MVDSDYFLRAYTPDRQTYYQARNGTSLSVAVVLAFRAKGGSIVRYGAALGSYDSSTGIYLLNWFVLDETVPFRSDARAVEWSYGGGTEGLWVVNGTQALQYWVKNATIVNSTLVTTWSKGKCGPRRGNREHRPSCCR